MNIDIIGSLILTLIMMVIASLFNLNIFGCILLMIVVLLVVKSKRSLLYNIRSKFRFRRKVVGKEMKSGLDGVEL